MEEDKNWTTLEYPVGSNMDKLVKKYGADPEWKIFEVIINFNIFRKDIEKLCPGTEEKIELLRPLILRITHGGPELDDEYFEELKKL